jgi:hypothetical protein
VVAGTLVVFDHDRHRSLLNLGLEDSRTLSDSVYFEKNSLGFSHRARRQFGVSGNPVAAVVSDTTVE